MLLMDGQTICIFWFETPGQASDPVDNQNPHISALGSQQMYEQKVGEILAWINSDNHESHAGQREIKGEISKLHSLVTCTRFKNQTR